MPTRPCRWCLSLQDGSVFADFDQDADDRIFLRRISFDGYGCCHLPEAVTRMSSPDSRVLIDSFARNSIDNPRIEPLLRAYFQHIADMVWRDALIDHELI